VSGPGAFAALPGHLVGPTGRLDLPKHHHPDALRWEVRRGRVVRLGRGLYRYCRAPASTARRIRLFAARCHHHPTATAAAANRVEPSLLPRAGRSARQGSIGRRTAPPRAIGRPDRSRRRHNRSGERSLPPPALASAPLDRASRLAPAGTISPLSLRHEHGHGHPNLIRPRNRQKPSGCPFSRPHSQPTVVHH
jgi:hypothetical protein